MKKLLIYFSLLIILLIGFIFSFIFPYKTLNSITPYEFEQKMQQMSYTTYDLTSKINEKAQATVKNTIISADEKTYSTEFINFIDDKNAFAHYIENYNKLTTSEVKFRGISSTLSSTVFSSA